MYCFKCGKKLDDDSVSSLMSLMKTQTRLIQLARILRLMISLKQASLQKALKRSQQEIELPYYSLLV